MNMKWFNEQNHSLHVKNEFCHLNSYSAFFFVVSTVVFHSQQLLNWKFCYNCFIYEKYIKVLFEKRNWKKDDRIVFSMNKIITPCEKWILSSEFIFSFLFRCPYSSLSFATIIDLKILSSLLLLWKNIKVLFEKRNSKKDDRIVFSMNKIIAPCEKWILSSEFIISFLFRCPYSSLSFATIIDLKILSSLLPLWKNIKVLFEKRNWKKDDRIVFSMNKIITLCEKLILDQ